MSSSRSMPFVVRIAYPEHDQSYGDAFVRFFLPPKVNRSLFRSDLVKLLESPISKIEENAFDLFEEIPDPDTITKLRLKNLASLYDVSYDLVSTNATIYAGF